MLNHLLHNHEGIRVAIIVNDMSEVNVDADLVRNGEAKLLRSEDKLRFLLPQLGYYFSSGPWRNCWRRERLEAQAASLHGVARA